MLRTRRGGSFFLAAGALLVVLGFAGQARAASLPAEDAAKCRALTALDLRDVRVLTATPIASEPIWKTPTGPDVNQNADVSVAFCRVEGVIEKEIDFELWLPASTAWNGRFLGLGNGGDAGFIAYKDLGRGVTRGFASASTNTGHKLSNIDWAQGRPDRVENYGHRAHNLLAIVGKQLTARYYAKPIAFSYFMGCSGGGMQAMNLAQRYPGNYDGIIAGASGYSIAPLSARFLYSAILDRRDPSGSLTPEQWNKVADAALAACDKLDGVEDRVVTDPRRCKFKPESVPGLTKAQAQRVSDLYAPLATKDGRQLYPGFLPGVRYIPQQRQVGIATRTFQQWVYDDPTWKAEQFELGRDLMAAEDRLPGIRFSNPDLSPLERRGGKLIMYIGWMDGVLPAESDIEYYDSVVKLMGKAEADKFLRLFMVPGMGHCGGGEGADAFGQPGRADPPIEDADHDMLTALMQWVEKGRAPNKLIASRVASDGKVAFTRPLCPYPAEARFKGGEKARAESFACSR